MYYSSKPVLKTPKTFKTLRHVSISYEIILREFFISLLSLLSLKFTLNLNFKLIKLNKEIKNSLRMIS